MVPGLYNYDNQYRGDTLDSIQFTILDKVTRDPINLTGATIKCQFRKPFNGATIKEITSSDGITIINASGGIFKIDEFLITWDAGAYLYDIEVTFSTGVVKTYVKGSINIISDTTI